MAYVKHYKGSIWTNHALERLNDRNIPQDLAWKAFSSPDSTSRGKKAGTTEYIKTVGKHEFTIIATQNEKREWVILSCWVHPPFEGSIDIIKRNRYLAYKKSGTWGKIWINIKRAFGFYSF